MSNTIGNYTDKQYDLLGAEAGVSVAAEGFGEEAITQPSSTIDQSKDTPNLQRFWIIDDLPESTNVNKEPTRKMSPKWAKITSDVKKSLFSKVIEYSNNIRGNIEVNFLRRR